MVISSQALLGVNEVSFKVLSSKMYLCMLRIIVSYLFLSADYYLHLGHSQRRTRNDYDMNFLLVGMPWKVSVTAYFDVVAVLLQLFIRKAG